MAIVGEELEDFVIDQINARQRLHGSGAGNDIVNTRTDQQINLLISNTSWVKLASGVSVTGAKLTKINVPSSYEGMGLAKQYVLNAGFSKLEDGRLQQREGFLPQQSNSSYTYGTYGYSPMPGIISADVKTLNRGSLKKATVRIKINNKEQFDIIDVLYLRLGFTVLLEWGNSIYTSDGVTKKTVRDTLVDHPKYFFNPSFGSKRSYRDILPAINSFKSKYAGNYDALLGKVSNFSWAFNPDGSYDAEITIISLGDVIESLKLNISTDKGLRQFIIESGGEFGDNTANIGVELTGVQLTAPQTASKGAKIAKKLMKDLGLKDFQAAAIVGNMIAEGFPYPDRIQGNGIKVGKLKINGTTGYGWAQWTSSNRQQALADYAKSKGVDYTKTNLTDDINYGYLVSEFPKLFSSVLADLKKTTGIRQATSLILKRWESPKDQSDNVVTFRTGFSNQVLGQMKNPGQEEHDNEVLNNNL